ncbi:hypothetical protein SCHPADRAFT_847669 [Schizopora paradoxa]|uniref:Uncharacterized protein n=1 Tax=Schizopora paradoxa TaxID=27342 RepID=A0A0H2RXB4_9AGAM|nr:hypothetical protein SCHPADRAFT_847669 [Schizopora paradoxa]
MSYSSSFPSSTSRYSQLSQDFFFQPQPDADRDHASPGSHPLRDLQVPGRHRPPPLPLGSSSTLYDPPSQSKEYLLDTASSRRSSVPYSPYSNLRTSASDSKPYDDTPNSATHFLLRDAGIPSSESRRTSSTYVGRRPPTSGWYAHFEATDWKSILIHTVAVACAYPFLILVCLLASNKTLFWSRVIVGFGCGILAFALGRTPFCAARRYLEASTWATFIHESTSGSRNGLPISVLAERTEDPMGAVTVFKLLYRRNFTKATAGRKRYDKTPWSLVALFFLFLVGFSSTLTFIFGRIVDITTFTQRKYDKYDEVPIFGDLSDEDINNANNLTEVLNNFISTWTLAPFASLTNLPKPVSFQHGNDTVYFAETYTSQLQTTGSGMGTFDLVPDTATEPDDNVQDVTGTTISSGVVQFPKWGIRIACSSIPNIESYLVPVSENQSLTYIFVPKDLVHQLFNNLSLQMPDVAPVNLTKTLNGDSINITVDPSSIVTIGKFFNNGVGHSLFSKPVDMGASGNGWTTIEVVSVRLNDTYTPSGTFPIYGDPILDSNGTQTRIGYDAAVCVEAYEPWVIESFNSTGLTPSSRRIVRSGNGLPAPSSSDPGGVAATTLNDVERTINSTGKATAYSAAHDNSVNQMVKDNGRDFFYVPSPMVVSFTSGNGPSGYTQLSPSLYAAARASADATNVLPFLAGTKQIVGRRYADLILANASVNMIFAVIALGVIFVVGIVAASCVPRLPFGVPQRGFDLFSWLTVLYGDNLSEQLPNDMLKGGLGEKVDTTTTKERIGSLRLRYAPEH